MVILNKKQTVKIINDSSNIQSKIKYNNNSFTMNVVGDIMSKQDNKISLNSIYELMITKFESIENKFESIENRFISIEKRLENIETDINIIKTDINIIKCLPTIAKELRDYNKNKKFDNIQ